ncbi:efflux RND transporter permease subunit [Parvularcula sp. LCG005]|uniref:efflux RND transporter permease subunit n=1 Tax=Parvularcula sp. LCG005 TaxID=3078805 RepID=UPI002943762F|nr:efflux RND transporter permease subunit [Parvularcula sp. LCG005]WOI53767.1 efflux RND transporter permease subunit [Parvularcula sp. LCG005]
MAGISSIVDAAFDRSKVALLLLVVLGYLGVSTYLTAPREADPDIPLPFVSVILPLPGVAPEDAERLLIRPTETELQNLEGLVQMDAAAFDSVAQFMLEFEPGLDMDQVVINVREAVSRAKSEFPAAAMEPQVREINAQTMFPVIKVIVSGEAPERALLEAAKALQDRLMAVPGVMDVELVGDREEVVNIVISPEAMALYGLTPLEVSGAIRNNNTLVTGGNLRFEDGSYAVKLPGLLESLDDLRAVPVRADANDIVTLGDIAEIRRTFDDPDGYARFNGNTAIALDVTKRSDINLLDLTEAVKTLSLQTAAEWPSTMTVSFMGDTSILVDSIFSSLTASIALAIILVMIVVVAALGLRSALLVGIAIPASFLIGFAFIGFFGFTLNNLVMFSLVLSVGMLVDGAIVIVELADRRMAEGADRRDAFLEASKRMFWPIVASTATTLAAFVPFLFWDAIEGYFMRWIPITLILVLSSSLAVALIFLPVIGASFGIPDGMKRRFHLKGQVEGRERVDLDNIDPTTLPGFTGSYARMVASLVKKPVLMIGLTVIGVMMIGKFFALSNVPVEQFLRVDNEQINVYIHGRGNISSGETLEVAQEVERRVMTHPAVEFVYVHTGPEVARGRDAPIEAIAQVDIDLIPYADRDHSLEVVEEIRSMTQGIPGVIVEVRQPEQGPMVGKDVQIELRADNYDHARAAAARVRRFMEESTTSVDGQVIPTFIDIEDNQPLPGIEWVLDVDRSEAGRYGLSIADVGAAIQLATDGLIVDTYRPDDTEEELDIRLRYPEDDQTLGQLEQIEIATPLGNVPLSNFVKRVPARQLNRLDRRDSSRLLEIQGNANRTVPGHPVSQDQATAAMADWLDSGALSEEFGQSVQWRLRGAAEKTAETGAWFQGAMVAAMAMIGLILLLQFNSFYHAALTLSAVVLSVYGVLLGVALSGQYVSQIMTGVGIVALAGIVVNNNIVLIDTYHSLRQAGLGVHEASIRTAAQRLRPVLLTTITTIIGLLPMVFEINIDFKRATVGIGNATSDWWVLLSSAIVYGLAFATLLTLILTPVLLAAPTEIGGRMKGILHKGKAIYKEKRPGTGPGRQFDDQRPASLRDAAE